MAEKNKKKKLSALELSAFSIEMANMLKAGISAIEAITLMEEEAASEEERTILKNMKEHLEINGSLSQAIKESGLFPEYYQQMIELGEQTGRSDQVMSDLEVYYSREASIRRAVRNAISYPLLMVIMMLVVIVVLITQVMPLFERVFTQLGSQMSGISGGLLALGNILRNYSVVFIVVLLIAAGVVICMVKHPKGQLMVMKLGYKWRGIRKIYERIAASRFANGMSIALKSGMNTRQALEMTAELVNNPFFKEKIENCIQMAQEYVLLSKAIADTNMFPGVYGRMIRISEKTGNLEEVLERIAVAYRTEADEEIDNIISMVEPTLVILLSIIVGIILLSVMLPLLGIMSGIN